MSNIVEEFLIPGTNKGLFYGGQFQASTSASEITVLDPARGTPFTTVPNGSAEDIRAAVSAARAAFPAWAELDALDRGRYLRAFADVIRKNIPLLASNKPTFCFKFAVKVFITNVLNISNDLPG